MTLGAAGLAVSLGGAAVAAPSYQYAPSVQIGYTDSANPTTAYDASNGVDMPLGAWQDEANVVHKSRVYATFDLTPFKGKRVIASTLRFREVSASDCTKRAIEIWQTNPVDATPTWRTAPAEVAKLDEALTPEFCPAILTSDVVSAVNDALAAGRKKITFEIRVPAALEGDLSYGRKLSWYSTVILNMTYNSVPLLKDRYMFNGGFPCTTTAPYPHLGWFAGQLQGMGSDADANDERYLMTEFAVWPESDPASRAVYTSTYSTPGRVSGVSVPDSGLLDGQGYAWQYRVGDGVDTTAWSKTCHFVVDRTAPPAPAVSSSNYPSFPDTGLGTPLGKPGQFTFSGGGNTDVAGFEYRWEMLGVAGCGWQSGDVGQHECPKLFSTPGTVRADVPGGTATIKISPDRGGPNTLKIKALDAAGNRSAEVSYQIFAPSADPQITVVGPEPEWNQQVTLKFTPYPGVKGTTKFVYRLDFGAEQTVAADADGTATMTFLASNVNGHQVTVRSYSSNGWVSPEGNWWLNFYPWPTVRSDVYLANNEPTGGVGVPGTFTFGPPPGVTQVQGYRYSFNGGEFVDVPAGADGKASVTWTPDVSGDAYVEVFAILPDGNQSDYSNFYAFIVAGPTMG
jgi:hypothetical protein